MKLYKIIQLLRLSRLVLLIILLLFAVIAKIARAETAYLYQGRYHYGGAVCNELHATPQAVLETCYRSAETGYVLGQPKMEGGDYPVNDSRGYWTGWGVSRWKHTCDSKELTHNGEYSYAEGLNDIYWHKAPQGDDAALWFPDKFSSCENNCVVRNNRSAYHPKSVTEKDGTSWSAFTKRQTGEVCVPQKSKKNDPPKSPPADNGDSSSQGNTGNTGGSQGESGNSQGSENSGGSSGSNGQANQGSGNSNDSGTSSGGSGSGSGGVNGSGGQTGPSGGGTSGGQNGGSASGDGEGETGGESGGSGEESGGSGDSGSEGGTDSGGQGNVGGDGNNGQNGQPGGTGEGDGQGSISGGSCEANQAPDCKGDPIQCYIAREQWRTACAALANKSEIKGNGNCRTQTPPECKGDATQCYIVKQQFLEGCARQSLEDYGREQAGNAQSYTEGDGFDSIGDAIGDNDSIVNVPSQLNTSGYGLTRTCPTLQFDIDVALFGSFRLDFSILCGLANLLGNLFVVASLVISARYILR